MHLCAELIAASMMLEPLGEVGANFSLQLSSRKQFTKINNKKLLSKINVKNIKNRVFFFFFFFLIFHKILTYKLVTYSRGTKVEKMLTLTPDRYTAEFCVVAK